MKLLEMSIYNKNDEHIRYIDFSKNNFNVIYGDIKYKDDKNKSNNSLGKTTLIKMIDYILRAAPEDKGIIKTNIYGWYMICKVKHNGDVYKVKRVLGDDKNVEINDAKCSIEEYKTTFNIDTQLYSMLSRIYPKIDIISTHKGSNDAELIKTARLLNLDNMINMLDSILKYQKEISDGKREKDKIIKDLKLDPKNADQELYRLQKIEVELTEKINKTSNDIKNLKLDERNEEIQKEFSLLNNEIKNLRTNLYILESEKKNYSEHLSKKTNAELDSKRMLSIYKRSEIEIPEMIVRKISELEEFYKKVILDRNLEIQKRIDKLDSELSQYSQRIKDISFKLKELSEVLSNNEAYKNAVNILIYNNKQIEKVKYQLGKLNSYSIIKNTIENNKTALLKEFTDLNHERNIVDDMISRYQKFIFQSVEKIYKNDSVSFNIETKSYNETRKPIKIVFDISNSGAIGGVKSVKFVLFDYLLFRFNNVCDFYLIDSSSYDPIDPRQVTSLIEILKDISDETNKQAFLCINRYQFEDDIQDLVREYACITLHEDDLLLKKEF